MLSHPRPRRHRGEGLGFLSQTGEHQTGNASACSPLKSSRGICACTTVTVQIPGRCSTCLSASTSMARIMLCGSNMPSMHLPD